MLKADDMVEVAFWDEQPSLEAEHYDAYGVRLRADCRPAMQNHLRQRFLDAQGPSTKDAAARTRRIENAKRFTAWQARDTALSSTGQRPVY